MTDTPHWVYVGAGLALGCAFSFVVERVLDWLYWRR